MSFEFKIADLDDIYAIENLVNSAYRGNYSKNGWTTEADFLEGQRIDADGIADLIRPPNSVILLLYSKTNSDYKGDQGAPENDTKAWSLETAQGDRSSKDEIRSNRNWYKSEPKRLQLIGCLNLQNLENYAYLGMVTVEPLLQNQKLGRRLLEKAEEIAKMQWKKNSIRMSVISIRHELIAWYLKRGYRLTGEQIPFPDNIRNGIPKQKLEMIILDKSLTYLEEKSQ